MITTYDFIDYMNNHPIAKVISLIVFAELPQSVRDIIVSKMEEDLNRRIRFVNEAKTDMDYN